MPCWSTKLSASPSLEEKFDVIAIVAPDRLGESTSVTARPESTSGDPPSVYARVAAVIDSAGASLTGVTVRSREATLDVALPSLTRKLTVRVALPGLSPPA